MASQLNPAPTELQQADPATLVDDQLTELVEWLAVRVADLQRRHREAAGRLTEAHRQFTALDTELSTARAELARVTQEVSRRWTGTGPGTPGASLP